MHYSSQSIKCPQAVSCSHGTSLPHSEADTEARRVWCCPVLYRRGDRCDVVGWILCSCAMEDGLRISFEDEVEEDVVDTEDLLLVVA